MDKNNVLSISFDSDKLDKDLFDWSSLPEDRRLLSDNICKESYGCTNKELYNKLKSHILFNKDIDIQSIRESYDYDSIDRRDLIMRISLAKSMNNDVLIAIIYPYDPELMSDSIYKDNYREEFINIYNKFVRLSDKYQKLSNSYSIQLFGYNVRSMYQLIYPDIVIDNDNFDTSYVNSISSTIEESITEDLIDKNVISLYKCKILHCNDSISRTSTNGIFARTLINEVNGILYKECSENDVKNVIPYFTINEFNCILDDSEIDYDKTIEINSDKDYYNNICKYYDKFNKDKSSYNENTLLSLGWNPYVDPRKYMNKAKERQLKWYNEHSAHIIDLSSIEVNNTKSLLESTYALRNLYEELNLYPVYIVLSYTNTLFGNIIRRVKNCKFTHAGLTLDSDLSQILTFEFYDKKNKGFMLDSLDVYLNTYNDTELDLLCLFVDKDTINKLQDNISYFISNKSKTKYNFKNLINILRNKSKDNDPYNLSLVCSQFVDTILKLSDIDITNKSSNLVIPQDFEDINHPKVYKLYNGLGRKYNENKIEGKIEALLRNSNPEDISYNSFVNKVNESINNFIFNRYNITDNDNANKILSEFYNYIQPKSVR